MKKLMILAVAMVAMAMGGKAEAALRLTLTVNGSESIYFFQDHTFQRTAVIGSGVGITGTVDTLVTNYPGNSLFAQVKQNITLSGITRLVGTTITSVLDVVADVLGTDAFDGLRLVNGGVFDAQYDAVKAAPKLTFSDPMGAAFVQTSLSFDGAGYVDSGSATAVSVVNNAPTNPNSVASIVSAGGGLNAAVAVGVLSPPGFTLTNEISAVITTKQVGNAPYPFSGIQLNSTSLVTPVVPEPTSLALAGFAGIGMAVGAIRRRRQAKQAA